MHRGHREERKATIVARLRTQAKRAFTATEARRVFAHIDACDASRFGIVRLLPFDLDVPHRFVRHAAALAEDLALTGRRRSRRSDSVVASLLRAGASGALFLDRDTALAQSVTARLAWEPTEFSVYVVRSMLRMQRDAAKAAAGMAEALACEACSAVPDCEELLRWSGDCHHACCARCAWNAFSGAGARGRELRCPVCDARCAGPTGTVRPRAAPAPRECARASRARWLELPPTLAAVTEKKRSVQFVALDLAEASRLGLGCTRTHRDERLHVAAQRGDCYRLDALLAAGVDLGAANDYGQSALFVAAALGHTEFVAQLLDYARRAPIVKVLVDQAENSGCTALDAAQRGGHRATAELLRAAGATEGARHDLAARGRAASVDASAAASTAAPFRVAPRVALLVPAASAHPSAGSATVDDAFSPRFLRRLDAIEAAIAPQQNCAEVAKRHGKKTLSCATRAFFCDTRGWVCAAIAAALAARATRAALGLDDAVTIEVRPKLRFLRYCAAGGVLPPHTDLPKVDDRAASIRGENTRSTHTFLLYLTDDTLGGGTALLRTLRPGGAENALAVVQPRRGRFLFFPHVCPHEGLAVRFAPKVLLRGELVISRGESGPRSRGGDGVGAGGGGAAH